MAIDLDAYFQRIGYEGSREATFGALSAINLLHLQTIPFENLDPLMGHPILIDEASLEQKLVKGGRGGYCFEHSLLMRAVLLSLGFKVTGLSGRVIRGLAPGETRPRTHMALQIDLEGGAYLVDVGFGIASPTTPLRLETDIEQPTPHETYRFINTDDDQFEMQVEIGAEWMGLYRFDLQKQLPVDYEVPNWYTSTHPSSLFVTNLMAARVDTGCRHTLLDNSYALRAPNAPGQKTILNTVGEMREILADVFQIRLPDSKQLDVALDRIVQP
jgi:N-hydroxyarylamine O-acetyltransferase